MYGLKPREFERVNTGTGEQEKAAAHDVHAMLRENRAVEEQAGFDEVIVRPVKSRRKRDFWLMLIVGNLVIIGATLLSGLNPVTLLFGFAGLIMLSLGLTWIMWFVMDDY